jgi:DDE family transposase
MADLSVKNKNSGKKKGIFPDSKFIYDKASDTYTCPAGNIMRKRRYHQVRRAYEYVAGAKACNACKVRSQCTRAKLGRSIKRHEGNELIESAKAQSHSPSGKRDRVRRKHIGEGSFADAANNHGFKRSRWRRLWHQLIQDYLIAACQNIRKMINNCPSPRKTGITAENAFFTGPNRPYFMFFY